MLEPTDSKVLGFRSRRHFLTRRAPRRRMVEVAGKVGGIQAQVMSAAEWSLGTRVAGIKAGDVADALWIERRLAKTWLQRTTVHLVPSGDLALFVAALTGIPTSIERYAVRRGYLDAKQVEGLPEAIAEVLDGGPLNRRDLSDGVVRKLGSQLQPWITHSWGAMLRPAAWRGTLCFGPSRGNEVTFVRPDRWFQDWKVPDVAEARAEVARRYLGAFGPAAPGDLAYWLGINVTEAKRWLRLIDEETAVVDGERLLLSQDRRSLSAASGVRLLPHFDTYLLAHRDKSPLIDQAHYKKVYRPAAWISPTLLVDGAVAGVWESKRSGSTVRITMAPFKPVAKKIREKATSEAERLGRFLSRSVEVTWS